MIFYSSASINTLTLKSILGVMLSLSPMVSAGLPGTAILPTPLQQNVDVVNNVNASGKLLDEPE